MNSLSRHIEYLLLTHNCVVVPQFGAFVAYENSASRTDVENLFFPPNRVVRFNPDITEDDGLLVGVVRALYRCHTTDAKRMVQGMVLELRQQLLADGQVDFGSIGVFTQDEDGFVSFEPCQAGAVTPALYGLDAFMMPKLTTLQRNEKVTANRKRAMEPSDDSERNIVIRINRRSLRYALFSAAAVLICILFVMPIELLKNRFSQQASVIPTATEQMQPVSTTAKPAEPKAAPVVEAPAQPTEEQVAQQQEPRTEYGIVLASNVSRKNADRYLEDLHRRGYENATVHDNGKFLRVVLGGYASEEEAHDRNSQLHRESKEFAETWVMKL